MRSLETLIPPPVVAAALAFCMWLSAPASARELVSPSLRLTLAFALALCGVAIAVAGSRAFRRAKTTSNPLQPQRASTLVTGGIYQFTRNPMYVGVALVLLGVSVWLWWWPALLGPVAFIGYISRFQVRPEERALADKFGAEYQAYCERVRRWV